MGGVGLEEGRAGGGKEVMGGGWEGHRADSERESEGSHLLEEEQHEHLETERPLDLDAESGGLRRSRVRMCMCMWHVHAYVSMRVSARAVERDHGAWPRCKPRLVLNASVGGHCSPAVHL